MAGQTAVLETAIEEGLSGVFDFCEAALWPKACEAAGEVASVRDARALDAARVLLQAMSVGDGPAGPVRWVFGRSRG